VIRYKIVVAYDGTDYLGWQAQAQGATVAGVLQQTFKRVFKKEITLVAASRTDAGVHALGQVAAFTTDLFLPPDTIRFVWNSKLPPAISICLLEQVSLSFNPRHNVVEKRYQYAFSLKRPLPLLARYIWYYRRSIDIDKLRVALALFIGTHNFRSFCSSEYTGNTVRTIHAIDVVAEDGEKYVITFKGPAFLRHMIRRIVGACLHVASCKKLTIDDVKVIMLNHNPEHILKTAPATGLVLVVIEHKELNHQYQDDNVQLT